MTEIGVHLPQLVGRPTEAAVAEAIEYAVAAERLGYAAISANDHVVYHSPWLDGPTLRPAARPPPPARSRSRRSRPARRSCASPGARSASPPGRRRRPGAASRSGT